MTLLLAELLGPQGTVVAVDTSPENLDTTRHLLAQTPYDDRVVCRRESLLALPFPDNAFDLIWCSRVIHHLPDQAAGVAELRRVLKPDGWLAVREDKLLPHFLPFDIGVGWPGLERRLDVLRGQWSVNFRSNSDNVRYPFGWSQLLIDAGFSDVTAKSFLHELVPPLSEDQRNFMRDWLRIPLKNETQQRYLDPEDAQTIEAITDPNNPNYVLNRPDLHFLEVTSIYLGQA
jgi:SAM-dependent methyltransferase